MSNITVYDFDLRFAYCIAYYILHITFYILRFMLYVLCCVLHRSYKVMYCDIFVRIFEHRKIHRQRRDTGI